VGPSGRSRSPALRKPCPSSTSTYLEWKPKGKRAKGRRRRKRRSKGRDNGKDGTKMIIRKS
jgi:hypothetical protein